MRWSWAWRVPKSAPKVIEHRVTHDVRYGPKPPPQRPGSVKIEYYAIHPEYGRWTWTHHVYIPHGEYTRTIALQPVPIPAHLATVPGLMINVDVSFVF